MGQLLVRGLDDALIEEIKRRAAASGRSTEAEHREILRQALAGPKRRTFVEALMEIPDVGEDEDFVRVQDDDGHRLVPD